MLDIIIERGMVFDGTGRPGSIADVGIKNGKITTISTSGKKEAARKVIDASSWNVSPGFIDMHSHSDITLPIIPLADSVVHQGITTVVAGQCGISPAPLLEPYRESLIEVNNQSLGHLSQAYPWEKWTTFGQYLEFLEQTTISCNVVPLVGHGTIRNSIMGFGTEKPSENQLTKMRSEVKKAMDAGAFGNRIGMDEAYKFARGEEVTSLKENPWYWMRKRVKS